VEYNQSINIVKKRWHVRKNLILPCSMRRVGLQSAAWCCLSVLWLAATVPFSAFAATPALLDLSQAQPAEQVVLSKTQQQQLKQTPRRAALVWHGASPWINAVTAGARAEFADAGVEVVAVTDANYDPARQVADLENVTTLKPDFILTLAIDAASVKSSLQRAGAGGAKLVLLSNPVAGFSHPADYAGIVTDDMIGMGRRAARVLAEHSSKPLQVGMIFHDADYFITNTRDKAFVDALQAHPQLQLVARKGFVREQETSDVAAALLLQHPELDLIYVSWDSAAEGVLEALRAAGRKDIRVVTHDLGVNNLLDLARGGNMLATIADQPYLIGQTMAKVALLAELGAPTPKLTLVPFETVHRHNISEGWLRAFHSPLPGVLQPFIATENAR
jgi:ribose transport system substrate-binding protein